MNALSWADLTYVLARHFAGIRSARAGGSFRFARASQPAALDGHRADLRRSRIRRRRACADFAAAAMNVSDPHFSQTTREMGHPERAVPIMQPPPREERAMRHLYTWGGIFVVVFFSVVGDVILARAMKQVGDVHELWERSGLWAVVGRVLSNPNFSSAWPPWRRLSSACCSPSPGET